MHPFFLAERIGLFAEGRFLGKVLDEWVLDAQEFVRIKLPHLLVIAAIAFFLNRLLRLLTYHMTRVAEHHSSGPARLAQVKTLAGIIRATGLAIIGLIAGLQFADALGVNLAPLLASAGVAGIAVGLAAQNIVKDMLNGILILIEDQFNVGDTVRLAGLSGVVEGMTLRKTTVRDGDGTVYVIPNSQITTVANLSKDYSVATVPVSLDYSANPDVVLKLLTRIAMEIRNSPEFAPVFVADPQILGVDALKGSEVIFLVTLKTQATMQYGPMREFKRRVRLALEKNGLLPGDPNRIFKSVEGEQPDKRNRETVETKPEQDPTLLHPEEGSPFVSS